MNTRLEDYRKDYRAGVWSESKPHLLNKLNYSPWDVPICERIAAGFHN
jgi:hypothetical protein